MKPFIRKLFGRSQTRTTPATAARTNRPRLGIEALDDRCLPSATASLSGGVLTITTDGAATTAGLYPDDDTVDVGESYNNMLVKIDGEFPAAQVQKVVVDGRTSAQPIWFTNHTSLPADYYPAPGGGAYYGGYGTNNFYADSGGNTEFDGGHGTNNFYDATGSWDDFIGGTGDNVLYQVRPWEFVQTPPSGAAVGPVFTIAQPGNPYYDPANLNAPGLGTAITASIANNGQDVMLTGPTGGGFELSGTWTDTRTAAGAGMYVHHFSSSTAVSLVTGVGDVPLGNLGMTITTKADDLTSPVGTYDSLSLLGGALPLSQLSADASGTALGGLLSGTGLSFAGAGLSFGIALGSDPALAALNMPLSADIPYLYATATTVSSASFGSHMSASTGGYGGAVVIDPADPAIFVQFTDAQVGAFSGGVSLHGAIPYTPTNLPENADNPEIYGNVYLSAAGIALGDLPVAVSGSLVLGLDAQHDGAMLNLIEQTPSALKSLFGGSTGKARQGDVTSLPDLQALAGQCTAAMNDVEVGLNGSAALTTQQYGISLSIDAATGSVFYVPNADGSRTVTFDVSTVDPFAGTVLANIAPKCWAEIGGSITTGTSGSGIAAWEFNASVESSSLFGFNSDRTTIEADSRSMTATVDMRMRGLLGMGHLDLTGTVDLSTGDFDLTETGTLSLNAGVCSVTVTEAFDFGYHHGTFAADAALDARLQLGTSSNNVWFEVDGTVDLTVSRHGVDVSGNASLSGGVTAAGTSSGGSLFGIDFDNHGFQFTALGKKVNVNW